MPNGFIKDFLSVYSSCFTSPELSFPIALVWMYIGKLFAEEDNLKLNHKNRYLFNIVLIIIFAIALYIEWKFVCLYNDIVSMDVMFFLLPLCICIFALLRKIKIYSNSKLIRFLNIESIISYPLHPSVLGFFNFVRKFFGLSISIPLAFGLTILICHVVTLIIIKLETIPPFKILRYSH